MKKILIALDIDGTITDELGKIPLGVIDYLKKQSDLGAIIAFITGRFFPFAYEHLKDLPFNYFLATQNGAQLFEMPTKKNIYNYYLSKDVLMEIDHIAQDYQEDFIIYTDEKLDYQTFYRTGRFSKAVLDHILKLESMAFHPFTKLNCLTELPVRAFPCIKNFGTYEQVKPLNEAIALKLPVEQSLIQDPTSEMYCMNLITHSQASKGGAVKNILRFLNSDLKVIGAGNDRNDISLLKASDIAICIGHKAPNELKEVSSMIAETSGLGLIDYIEKAKQVLGL